MGLPYDNHIEFSLLVSDGPPVSVAAGADGLQGEGDLSRRSPMEPFVRETPHGWAPPIILPRKPVVHF